MKPNVMLNILGVTLILIAGIGMAVVGTGEEPEEEPESILYDIPFIDTSGTISANSVSLADGQSVTTSITISATNLQSVLFSISWSDGNPRILAGDVTVDISVTGPGGESASDSDIGRSGSFMFEFDNLNTRYNDTEPLRLEEGEDAGQKAEEEFPAKDGGSGVWEFTISVERAIRPSIFTTSVTINTDYEFQAMGEPVEV